MPNLKKHSKIEDVYTVEYTKEDFDELYENGIPHCPDLRILPIREQWGIIREFYKKVDHIIIEKSKKNIIQWGCDYYGLPWNFSPIEKIASSCIRNAGCIILYPQYPSYNYFIDFANPYLKIGLELDGEKCHDKIKDRKRDANLAKHGWIIFRVPRSECFISLSISDMDDLSEEERAEEIEKRVMNTCDGVINAIGTLFFWRNRHPDISKDLALSSLWKHCSVQCQDNFIDWFERKEEHKR